VALAGLLSALRITGGTLDSQRLLFLAPVKLPPALPTWRWQRWSKAARPRAGATLLLLFDSKGLVVAGRSDLAEHKRPYAHEHALRQTSWRRSAASNRRR